MTTTEREVSQFAAGTIATSAFENTTAPHPFRGRCGLGQTALREKDTRSEL